MVVGIAGKYCAGKDTLVALLSRRGFEVIDVDKVGHQVLLDRREEITQAFGPAVLSSLGEVNRRALGAIVFKNRKARRRLEAIVHPEMVSRVRDVIEDRGGRIIINAAILFHMGLHRLCDVVICVKAPMLVRLRRALKRDSLGLVETMKRILAQRRICFKFKTGDVDTYSVRNAGSEEDLEDRLESLLGELNIL